MQDKRVKRLNSLLKEVISEVIRNDVKDPRLDGKLITVTSVSISKDLHHAKVYVSIIGTDKDREETLEALTSGAGYIGVNASKKVVLRFFPTLTFKLDTTAEKQERIGQLIDEIHKQDG